MPAFIDAITEANGEASGAVGASEAAGIIEKGLGWGVGDDCSTAGIPPGAPVIASIAGNFDAGSGTILLSSGDTGI
ncbi:MAG: hypothetical protein H7A55_16495 [Verrucomicrobiaceae bacterium]|nr:hypothetical protein [Verrucomicrobiaceae bacterium]